MHYSAHERFGQILHRNNGMYSEESPHCPLEPGNTKVLRDSYLLLTTFSLPCELENITIFFGITLHDDKLSGNANAVEHKLCCVVFP